MRRSQSIRLGLAGTRKVFRLISELRTLSDRPELQRQRLCEGVCELITMPGQPNPDFEQFTAGQWNALFEHVTGDGTRRRSVRWFSRWAAGDGINNGLGHGAAQDNDVDEQCKLMKLAVRPEGDRTLRLLIAELYRVHRDGSLEGRAHMPPLTPRQLQVLEQLRAGRTATQIAHALKVSRRTVEEHIQAIYARFNVTTRAELMAVFIDDALASTSLN